MIYDTQLGITWLEDANYAETSGYDIDGKMDWISAVAWAEQLSYCGYNDWRLPHTLPVNGANYVENLSYDGSTDVGYNITSSNSELAFMYSMNLGNISYYNINGVPQSGYGLVNTGPFLNLQEYFYWSETELLTNPNYSYSWGFSIIVGGQRMYYQPNEHYVWAVRDGDVIPSGDIAPRGTPDGKVDVADLLVATQIILGNTVATDTEKFHFDLFPPNKPDGKLTPQDLLLLQKMVFQNY